MIKQVVENLRVAHPKLKKFVTLSPIPGLTKSLEDKDTAARLKHTHDDIQKLQTPNWFEDQNYTDKMQSPMRAAALAYLTDRQNGSHRLQDSVARFHLGNGARIENCLLYTSPSPRDKRQSRMPSSA